MKWILILVLTTLLAGCTEFRWITPEPSVPVEVVPEEEQGEVEPDPPLPEPSLDIKGNIGSSGDKIYHMPTGAYYDQVKIDESRGEQWFRTEEEAIAAGFRKSSR